MNEWDRVRVIMSLVSLSKWLVICIASIWSLYYLNQILNSTEELYFQPTVHLNIPGSVILILIAASGVLFGFFQWWQRSREVKHWEKRCAELEKKIDRNRHFLP